jgi:hypothetical protein
MWRMSWGAGEFDRCYAQMGRSGLRDQIARRALGLPSGMDASGLLPWAGVTEVAAALNLAPGQLLVDLGDITAIGVGTGAADAAARLVPPGPPGPGGSPAGSLTTALP